MLGKEIRIKTPEMTGAEQEDYLKAITERFSGPEISFDIVIDPTDDNEIIDRMLQGRLLGTSKFVFRVGKWWFLPRYTFDGKTENLVGDSDSLLLSLSVRDWVEHKPNDIISRILRWIWFRVKG